MAKPNLMVASKIRESTRFYPYFKNCLGAIDGTHIPAMVSNNIAPSYRNRKGVISQNVLAVCNFDMEFIYVLSGWEGSAHDSKVLYDALRRRTNRFVVPQEETEFAVKLVEKLSQNNEEVFETQDQERESANIWREAMAQQMWRDATN
ncbi:PREDICTED: uncharacterized protein LOC109132867 [Camelina sativa]|uniref:Uncharacterized protein LOC109132867 n=1 Tax=Camelina sativa TaxID=90675 RepID=A0ABM1RPB4_CAMSA|nr:PREDICTED: uncharacterized protein LOC109132867 [Camelina sativa]